MTEIAMPQIENGELRKLKAWNARPSASRPATISFVA